MWHWTPPSYDTEPAFSASDRVDGGGGGNTPPEDDLPEELKGKSPAEVARFFRERERILKSSYEDHLNDLESRRQPEPKATEPTEAKPRATKQEWLSDPNRVLDEALAEKAVSKADFTNLTTSQQDNLIWAAKSRAKEELRAEIERGGGTFHWDTLSKELDAIMAQVLPANKTSTETWKTAYNYAVGQNVSKITKEAVTKATMPAEAVRPGGNVKPKPAELSRDEKSVAEGLGLSDESFLKAKDNMEKQKWPLTMDNRQRR